MIQNVSRNHRSRTDDGEITDRQAAKYDCTRPDRCSPSNVGSLEPMGFILVTVRHRGVARTPRISIISENDARSDKHVIHDRNAAPNERAVLDGDAVTNAGAFLDETVTPDIALGTNFRAMHDMGERPHPTAGTNQLRFAQGLWMNIGAVRFGH